MTDHRRALGSAAERHAADYLERLGWRIVARNWRAGRFGELDLVAEDGAALVFVEVRARRGLPGAAAETVTAAKQARLIRLAQHYLAATGEPESRAWRIDVVAIDLGPDGRVVSFEHIRSAVEE